MERAGHVPLRLARLLRVPPSLYVKQAPLYALPPGYLCSRFLRGIEAFIEIQPSDERTTPFS